MKQRHHKKPARGGSEVLYNDALGTEVPSDERVLEPATLLDLAAVNFSQLPIFVNVIGMIKANAVVQKYPFKQGYSIYPSGLTRSAERPPAGRVAVYTDHSEVGLRMPTMRFFRDSLRYWGVRITQLVLNVDRIRIGFEILCREQ